MDFRYLFRKLGHIYVLLLLFFIILTMASTILGEKLLLEKYRLDFSLWVVILTLVIAPILEELVFRNWLSLKAEDIRSSIIFCLPGILFWFSINEVHLLHYISFGVLMLLYFLSYFYKGTQAQFLYISLSSLIFGIIHLTHIEDVDEKPYLFIILNTMPQVICGYYFAKVRLERGILYAIALHFLVNILPVLSALFRYLF